MLNRTYLVERTAAAGSRRAPVTPLVVSVDAPCSFDRGWAIDPSAMQGKQTHPTPAPRPEEAVP